MNLLFLLGLISLPLVFLTLIFGVLRILIYSFSKSKKAPEYFGLANVFLIISLGLVLWMHWSIRHAGVGSVSGLMIPLFMPIPGGFCILYIIFSLIPVKSRNDKK